MTTHRNSRTTVSRDINHRGMRDESPTFWVKGHLCKLSPDFVMFKNFKVQIACITVQQNVLPKLAVITVSQISSYWNWLGGCVGFQIFLLCRSWIKLTNPITLTACLLLSSSTTSTSTKLQLQEDNSTFFWWGSGHNIAQISPHYMDPIEFQPHWCLWMWGGSCNGI